MVNYESEILLRKDFSNESLRWEANEKKEEFLTLPHFALIVNDDSMYFISFCNWLDN